MIGNRNATIAIAIASIVVQVFILMLKGNLNVPALLGGTLGLILAPYLLTLIIKAVNKAISNEFSERAFISTFMTIWGLLILANVVVAKYESTPNSEDIGAESSVGYVYSPRGCIYEIEYNAKPTIKQLPIVNGKSILMGEEASLTWRDVHIRSEFIVLGTDTIKSLADGSLVYMLNQYATYNGLDHPEFKQSESELGKQVELRAYKTMQDSRLNSRHVIVTAHLYFKGNNFLILYAQCDADKYPTPAIVKFYNSVRLK